MARAAPFTLAVSNFPYLLFICFLSILSFITIPITYVLFLNNPKYLAFQLCNYSGLLAACGGSPRGME